MRSGACTTSGHAITTTEIFVTISRLMLFGFDGEWVRFVSGVSPHVSRDHVPATGCVRALGALVGLFAGVGALVSGQMVRSGEYLTANPARVRFDPRVESHVSR